MGVQKKNVGISNESQHDAGNDGPKKDMVTRITQGAIAGEVQVRQKPVARDGGDKKPSKRQGVSLRNDNTGLPRRFFRRRRG